MEQEIRSTENPEEKRKGSIKDFQRDDYLMEEEWLLMQNFVAGFVF